MCLLIVFFFEKTFFLLVRIFHKKPSPRTGPQDFLATHCETEIGDKEHQFDYCFDFDTNTKSRFVRISFVRLSKFKSTSGCLYYNIPKKNDKNIYFGNFFFHWLEIEQIGKILIEISKFELNIEKTI